MLRAKAQARNNRKPRTILSGNFIAWFVERDILATHGTIKPFNHFNHKI